MRIVKILIFVMFVLSSLHSTEIEHTTAFRTTVLSSRWPQVQANPLFPQGGVNESQTNLRHSMKFNLGEVRWHFALENSLVARNGSRPFPLFSAGQVASSEVQSFDFDTNLHNRQTTDLVSRIDRLNLSFTKNNLDYKIGRQPISLGTSHYVSVLDILSPFAPGTLDGSFKPGLDAIRVNKALGWSGEMGFIFVPGQNGQGQSFLFRSRQLVGEMDWEYILGRFRNREMLGIGFEGEVRGVPLWGEVAFFSREKSLEKYRGGPSDFVTSFIIGMDQHRGRYHTTLAYYQSDFGTSNPADLFNIGFDAAFAQGFMFLRGRKYLILNHEIELKPLVRTQINTLYNLEDESFLIQPRLNISLAQNMDLSLFSWIGYGKKLQNSLKGEFSDLPDFTLGAFFSYYF